MASSLLVLIVLSGCSGQPTPSPTPVPTPTEDYSSFYYYLDSMLAEKGCSIERLSPVDPPPVDPPINISVSDVIARGHTWEIMIIDIGDNPCAGVLAVKSDDPEDVDIITLPAEGVYCYTIDMYVLRKGDSEPAYYYSTYAIDAMDGHTYEAFSDQNAQGVQYDTARVWLRDSRTASSLVDCQ